MTTHSRWRSLAFPVSAATIVAGLLTAGLLWAGNDSSPAGPASKATPRNQASSPTYGSAPSYTLTDQNGQQVSSGQFTGKVQVVSFLFPYCTTDCPLLARDLAVLQHKLAAQGLGGKVTIVTFNVDPGGAGPEQLTEFLRQYGGNADPGTAKVPWYYLTGSSAQIERVVRDGYHVAYWKVRGADEAGTRQRNTLAERAKPGYDIKHSGVAYLIDATGKIRTVYSGATAITTGTLLTAVRKTLN
jgi:protein SCO1